MTKTTKKTVLSRKRLISNIFEHPDWVDTVPILSLCLYRQYKVNTHTPIQLRIIWFLILDTVPLLSLSLYRQYEVNTHPPIQLIIIRFLILYNCTLTLFWHRDNFRKRWDSVFYCFTDNFSSFLPQNMKLIEEVLFQITLQCKTRPHGAMDNFLSTISNMKQSGAVEACCAHNPEVRRLKLGSAIMIFYFYI